METLKQYSNMVVSLETEAEEMRTKIRDLQAKIALFERHLTDAHNNSYPKIEAPSLGAANAA
eukprot:COSAG02_NODE_3479_length_6673_cov_3.496197_5_plen_62_part_00